jgi:quercetin dioxygenase-like cupin family protein
VVDSNGKAKDVNEQRQDRSAALLEGCGLVDLAAYQDQSIVSQTLMKKKAGTITLFAFDKGQELSEHETPFDALVYVLEGSAEIAVGGVPHRVPSGDMLLLPANIPHAVKATERFKMLLVMIRSE